jgi:hypothetical protein
MLFLGWIFIKIRNKYRGLISKKKYQTVSAICYNKRMSSKEGIPCINILLITDADIKKQKFVSTRALF